jgi:phosphatidylserine/phosphatidylglycerophosphate/cardiolipin synthase-like enzyme
MTQDAPDHFRVFDERDQLETIPAVRTRDDVEVYCWPFDHRPAGARLHAKTAGADGELAFVTRANLTGHALDQNLEVGVLIRGGSAPRRLMQDLHALIARGTLTRI